MSRTSRKRAESHGDRARRGGAWFNWILGGGIAFAVLVIGLLVVVGGPGPPIAPTAPAPSASPGPTPSLLAPVPADVTGQPIDGLRCDTAEQVLFHVHAHLAVMVGGQPGGVPEGIGIAPPRTEVQTATGPYVQSGACFYWLHGHTADGIIHIESPVQQTYTLGQYFSLWRQPLDGSHVGSQSGPVVAYVNGQRFNGNPRDIPLTAHALIQLDVGGDVPPQSFTFPLGL